MKHLRPVHISILLLAGVIALYYPSLLSLYQKPSVFNIDDDRLLDFILNHDIQMREFFVSIGSGKYFRPGLLFSFYLDQHAWGADAFGFRLTNVIIHALNAVLVFLSVDSILRQTGRSRKVAVLSAILFGIHPIAVESVAWISGRTDPLATLWGLLALWLYLLARKKRMWYLLPLALLCAAASVLSKEVGLAIPILIVLWETAYAPYYDDRIRPARKTMALLSAAVAVLYFVMRSGFLGVRDMSLVSVAKGISSDAVSSVLLILSSVGFYLKKFIFPFPLSFVIEDIRVPLYATAGGAAILSIILAHLSGRARHYRFFLLWALLGIAPAVVVSATDIAWTRWAERYVYFSLVPLCAVTAMLFFELSERMETGKKRLAALGVVLILSTGAVATVRRSLEWNDNLRFWEGAANVSPDSVSVAAVYASTLLQRGMPERAEAELKHALSLSGPKHRILFLLGELARTGGDWDRAERYYEAAFNEAKGDKRLELERAGYLSSILLAISDVNFRKGMEASVPAVRAQYVRKGLDLMSRAYEENPSDTFILYGMAKHYMAIDDRKQAVLYFRRYLEVARQEDVYHRTAEALMIELE